MVRVHSEAGILVLDPGVGNLRQLEFSDGDRRIAPLATAPWVGRTDINLPVGLAPVEQIPKISKSPEGATGSIHAISCRPFGAFN